MTEQLSKPPIKASAGDHGQPAGGKIRSKLAGLRWLGKSLLQAVIVLAIFVAGIALVGLAQRIGWLRSESDSVSSTSAAHDHASTYTCSMHPQIRQPEPGKCPICGMDLIEATGNVGGDDMAVTIEPAVRRLVGIQTATAEQGPVSRTIRTTGSIDYDESKLATISAYVDGRLEKLYADYVGVPVSKNDDLALIYSPELYSAQVEFLTAADRGGLQRLGGGERLAEMAKQNLVELGLTEAQITELQRRGTAESRIRIKSPISGTVIDKYAVEGDYVETGDKIYRVAGLSSVWLMLDLYPEDAARVRFGQQVEAELQSVPGEVFTGRVAFIAPTVNAKTRTVRVRVEMLNPDGKLRPGDYATARVRVPAVARDRVYDPALAGKFISPMHPQVVRDEPGDCPICGMDLIPTSQLGFATEPLPAQPSVTVPRDAVLMAGNNSVLYVETTPGRFEIRRVTVGPLTDDRAVILEGLSAGETVATHGNFLIDSQMQLSGNPSLMDPSKAPFYPDGPLQLPDRPPVILTGESGEAFDRAYQAYLRIQQSLAADQVPPPDAVGELSDALRHLYQVPEVPDAARHHVGRAQQMTEQMNGSLQRVRKAFRPLSHALLRAANVARSRQTGEELVHFYCPMVPGRGGDWIQTDENLVNPYWGDEMLSCGERVGTFDLQEQR